MSQSPESPPNPLGSVPSTFESLGFQGISHEDQATDGNASHSPSSDVNTNTDAAAPFRFGSPDTSFSFSLQQPLESSSADRTPQRSPRQSPAPYLTPSSPLNPQTPPGTADSLAADVSSLALSPGVFAGSWSRASSVDYSREASGSPSPSGRSGLDRSSRSENTSLQVADASQPVLFEDELDLLPNHPYFTVAYQRLLSRGKKVAEDIHQELVRHEEVNTSKVEQLTKRALALTKPDLHDTRTIAILGDSGEGKSSLINSLLDCPELSRTADIGSACTTVVTEFRYQIDESRSPFQVEVEYLKKPEIEDMIKELVWNYRHIMLPDTAADTMSAEEFQQLEREREVAWSALDAAFGHHKELKNLCDRDHEGAYDDIVQRLIEWAGQLEWPDEGIDGRYQYFANTAEECSEKTEQFMDDRFWPFTKVIRIFTRSQVLKSGLILVDLPGLRDTNLARVKATEDYILGADHIFIVAKISRVVSNQSLKACLHTVRRHVPNEWEEHGAKRLNITVVCTRAEDMNFKDMKKEFVVKRKVLDAQKIELLDSELKQADKRSDSKLKKGYKLELLHLYMQARNNFVISNLQKTYAQDTQGEALDVLCVSNTVYTKASLAQNASGMLASNIPALRKRCHSVVTDIRLAESNNFLLSTLPGLMESVHLWHQLLTQPRKEFEEAFGTALNKLNDDFIPAVQTQFTKTKEALAELFSDQISAMMESRNGHWDRAALTQSRDWASWHWASYNAFVRNDGTHTTPKVGHRRWNNEMLWKMREELQLPWNIIGEEIPNELRQLKEYTKGQLEQLAETIPDFETLARAVRLHIANLEYQTGLVERLALDETRLLQRKASEDNYTSFMLGAMKPAYREAAQIRGTGTNRNQIARITRQIDDDLFTGIAVAINLGIENLLTKISTKLQEIQDQMNRTLLDDFHLADSQGPPWSEALDRARDGLHDLIERERPEMQEIKGGMRELGFGMEVIVGDEEEEEKEEKEENEEEEEEEEED